MSLETVLNLIVRYIKEHAALTDDEAIGLIYTSRIYKLLEDESNSLWSESPCYLGELILAEADGTRVEIIL